MRRGTTPTHTYTLPFDTSVIKSARVSYAQFGSVILTKTGADLVLEGQQIQTKLTQEDTLRFKCSSPVSIQLKIQTAGGDVLVSDIMNVDVGRCLDSEVLA